MLFVAFCMVFKESLKMVLVQETENVSIIKDVEQKTQKSQISSSLRQEQIAVLA